MIYLDYSATTPPDKRVVDTFSKVAIDYFANSNSLHKIGVKSKELEDYATEEIANMLGIKPSEIIYTSCSSESNNLALKGICLKYQNRGKHIITTNLEHSSIIATCNYLTKLGFEVEFVDLLEDGTVNIDDLKFKLRDDTIMVSIAMIDSELGIRQPVEEIGTLLKNYPKCFYHVDCTQAIGKINVDFTNIDMASISAHKIYGLKGIGMLIKKENIVIEPLIHGGKSTTVYRSGTPALPLIVSLKKALELIIPNIDKNYEHISKLNKIIIDKLKTYDNVYINSTDKSIKNTINISINKIKPETFIHALEEHEIYVSTKSACSSANAMSNSIYAIYHDEKRASSTIRISLSHLTTKEDINTFLDIFDKCYKKLKFGGKNEVN